MQKFKKPYFILVNAYLKTALKIFCKLFLILSLIDNLGSKAASISDEFQEFYLKSNLLYLCQKKIIFKNRNSSSGRKNKC